MNIDDTVTRAAVDPPFAEAELPWNHPLARALSRLGRRTSRGTAEGRGSSTRR